ncbi:MAG: hypothetical protein ACOCQ4_01595, partial [bacterium]
IFFYDEIIEAPELMLDKLASFLGITKFAYKDSDKQINKGIDIKMPQQFKDVLINLNYDKMLRMNDFFNEPYPARWVKKYN